MYNISTYKKGDVHNMYMKKRPSIPNEIYETVAQQARPYENDWWATLERILEQEANIEIKSSKEVEA